MKVYAPVGDWVKTLGLTNKVPETGMLDSRSIVTHNEVVAMRIMNEFTGACFVCEISKEVAKTGADPGWGWDWGWRSFEKPIPISYTLRAKSDQFYVNRAEQLILGEPAPSLEQIANICRTPRVAFGPEAKALKDFRVLHGRSPTVEELRKMSKWSPT
jgi:hypothetical protein